MNHPDDVTLQEYFDLEGAPPSESLQRHLRSCGACAMRLSGMLAIRHRLVAARRAHDARVGEPHLDAPVRRRDRGGRHLGRRVGPIAAGLALLAGGYVAGAARRGPTIEALDGSVPTSTSAAANVQRLGSDYVRALMVLGAVEGDSAAVRLDREVAMASLRGIAVQAGRVVPEIELASLLSHTDEPSPAVARPQRTIVRF